MKNLLVLTRKFAPQNYIASIRPTKIIKYLKINFGYNITVCFQKDVSNIKDTVIEKDVRHVNLLHEISSSGFVAYWRNKYDLSAVKYSTSSAKVECKKKNYAYNIFNLLKSLARNSIYILDIYDQFLYSRRVICSVKRDSEVYDCYFSTTNLIESYLVASYLKKKSKLTWILDLRDPILVDTYPFIARKIYHYYILKAANLADYITGVSLPCIDYFPKKERNRIVVIPNGYDMDDIEEVGKMIDLKPSKLILAYAGTLYNGKQNLRALFRALALCASDKSVDLENVEVHYAGRDGVLIRKQMKEYGIESILIDHGYVSRKASLEIQMKSDALLLASWNTEGNMGIVTGKFYEYLMMRKNIICLISGNKKQSTLKEMIDNAKCGYCYEEADEKTYEGLVSFVMRLYESIVVNKRPCYFPNQAYIEQFSYKYIAAEFDSLLQQH